MINANKEQLQVSGSDSEIYNDLRRALQAWYMLLRDRGTGEYGAQRVIGMLVESTLYRIEDEYQAEKAKKKG